MMINVSSLCIREWRSLLNSRTAKTKLNWLDIWKYLLDLRSTILCPDLPLQVSLYPRELLASDPFQVPVLRRQNKTGGASENIILVLRAAICKPISLSRHLPTSCILDSVPCYDLVLRRQSKIVWALETIYWIFELPRVRRPTTCCLLIFSSFHLWRSPLNPCTAKAK